MARGEVLLKLIPMPAALLIPMLGEAHEAAQHRFARCSADLSDRARAARVRPPSIADFRLPRTGLSARRIHIDAPFNGSLATVLLSCRWKLSRASPPTSSIGLRPLSA